MPPAEIAAIAVQNAGAATTTAQATGGSSPRCPNCDAEATGNYCASCGQETTVALPTAGRFLREAAGRYVAFDGRLWRSLHALLLRPGFLTREYLAGRRRRYVRPARLFVVLSIVVFAILGFTARAPVVTGTAPETDEPNALFPDRVVNADPKSYGVHVDRGLNVRVDPGSAPLLAPFLGRVDVFNRLSRQEKVDRLVAGVLRYAPYAAVGLLPVFALLLKLAYAGRSRRHPARPRRYAAHLVFGAHNHAFLFLAASLMALIDFGLVRAALAMWSVVYALASMKAVYGGGWPGVVLRAGFIAVSYSLFFVVAIVGLVLAAVTLR